MSFLALLRRSLAESAAMGLALLALLAGFQVALVLQAASYGDVQFARMVEMMPSFLQRSLGSMVSLVASFGGLVTAAFYHPMVVIMMAQVAIFLATEPARDVEQGLVDLLLSRPIPRHWLITRSLIVVLAGTAVAGGVMTATLGLALHAFAPAGATWPATRTVAALALHLVAVAWCFGALGLAVAAGSRRRSTAFTVVGALAIFTYIVDFVSHSWVPLRRIDWLSPFHYYPAIPILAGVAPPWGINLLVLTSATAVFASAAYWRFSRRDV
jgi:ABC-type transport system involved in multi-copper enzyme maturation permease subunit